MAGQNEHHNVSKYLTNIGVYLYNTVSEFLNGKEGVEKRKSSNEEVTEGIKLFPKVMELCYDPSSLWALFVTSKD